MQCKAELLKLPYIKRESDLGLFTTSLAVQDLDAVRRQLGVEQIDLVGGSYGTRVALSICASIRRGAPRRARRRCATRHGFAGEFFDRQPGGVRSLVAACEAEGACALAHPDLHTRFAALLQGLPRPVTARARSPAAKRSSP